MIKEFKEELNKLNILCSNTQLELLERYYKILIEENKKYNLTSITKVEEVYYKHFYDSLTLSNSIDLKQNYNICDVGSGAGFPGIVLKIFFPHLNITLVDSTKKRTDFLNLLIKELKLKNIKVITDRIENLNKLESFDIITARAVAPLNVLLELTSKLIKINGYFIALKGKNGKEELKESLTAIKKLNLKVIDSKKILLPKNLGERTIIKIQKQEKTNRKYPRNYSKIKNNPL